MYELFVTVAAFTLPTIGMFLTLKWHHDIHQEQE